MTAAPQQAEPTRKGEPVSLADMVAVTEQPSAREFFTLALIAKVAVVAALLIAFNYWQFPRLVGIWRHNSNWTHGFVIPLYSIYLLYVRRDELLSARRRACLPGLPLMVFAILFVIGSFVFIHTMWFCNLGMIALAFSVVLYLAGPAVIRITWLPILFLVFAMPIPEMIYTGIAVPLQELAAKFSTVALRIFGAQIDATASALTITTINGNIAPLTVAEACSGVRSLMAFMALGVAWAYLEQRPIWQRVALVVSAVPIAILCNVIRVTITCTMYIVERAELGKDFMHTFTGMLMLGPALIMFWGLSKLLERIFVEVEEDEDVSARSRQGVEEAGQV